MALCLNNNNNNYYYYYYYYYSPANCPKQPLPRCTVSSTAANSTNTIAEKQEASATCQINLFSLEDRRLRAGLIPAFNIFNGGNHPTSSFDLSCKDPC